MIQEALTSLGHLVVLSLARTVPIWLAGLGGVTAELSGVINFALEGMMLMGAFGAVWAAFWSGSPWVGVVGGVLGGGLVGVLHAFVVLGMRGNQIVSSIALNILASGISGTLLNQVFDAYGTSPSVRKVPSLAELSSWLGGTDPGGWGRVADGISALVPMAVAVSLFLAWFFKKSVWGLRIRACGENPSAAEASGLSVTAIRWIAVVVGGGLAGLGGAALSIGDLSQFVEHMTQGRGYLAIAAVILGRWVPSRVILAALLFGVSGALSEWLSVRWPALPSQVFLGMPFALCLAVLLFRMGKKRPPSALGRLKQEPDSRGHLS